jgi:hypothetical protein
VSILISFQILRKAVSRLIFRLLADKPLPTKTPGEKLHILLLRWDAKLGDSIVSSFFFRESRKLNARLTVLTVNELAEMHTNTFGVDDVIVTNPHPGLGELRRLVNQLSNVDAVVHLVGRLQPAEIVFMRLLRPASIYSLDDSLRCVNRKMGFAANTLNIVEQYKYILQDLGAKVIDTQYIVPLPAELPPAALSPKYFLILMPAEETRGYPLPVQPQLYKLSPTSFPAIPWEFFAALQRCTVHSIWKTQLHAIMWQSCTTG